MRPLRIWARNLRTWADLDLEVPKGVVAIVGPNGAGKSSLVNTIDLALFADRGELNRCLTRGAGEEEVEVGIEFEHRGEVYRVRRSWNSRGGGKPRLDLMRAEQMAGAVTRAFDVPLDIVAPEKWQAVSAETATIAETEAELEKIIGLSRSTFRASSYLAQGDGDAFTMAEPRERKGILLDAIGVRIWDRLKERATALRAEAEQELSRLVGVCEQLEGRLAERTALEGAEKAATLEHDALKLAVADIEQGLQAARGELEDAIAQAHEAEARKTAAKTMRERCTEAEGRASELNGRIELVDIASTTRTGLTALVKVRPALERLRELRLQGEAKTSNLERLESQAAVHRQEEGRQTGIVDEAVTRLAVIEEVVEDLSSGDLTCPTCKQRLEGDALEAAREEVTTPRAEVEKRRDEALAAAVAAAKAGHQAEQEVEKAKAELDELRKEDVRISEAMPEEAKLHPQAFLAKSIEAEAMLAALDERELSAADDRAALEKLRTELPFLARQADNAEAAASEYATVDVDVKRAKVMAAETSLTTKRSLERDASMKVTRAKTRLEALDEAARELAEAQEARATVADAVEFHKYAERAYGRDGIPAMVLEALALPQLEAEANRIVAELGRSYRFELRTQKMTQAGAVREALDIVVMTETGEALYEDFSGGERTRLDLSLRIALARLLASRRGSDVRLLAIDEPAYLDDDGFAQLAKVLTDLAGEFETVLVVSHVDELRDAFDSALVVGGGADTGEPSRLEEGSA